MISATVPGVKVSVTEPTGAVARTVRAIRIETVKTSFWPAIASEFAGVFGIAYLTIVISIAATPAFQNIGAPLAYGAGLAIAYSLLGVHAYYFNPVLTLLHWFSSWCGGTCMHFLHICILAVQFAAWVLAALLVLGTDTATALALAAPLGSPSAGDPNVYAFSTGARVLAEIIGTMMLVLAILLWCNTPGQDFAIGLLRAGLGFGL